MPKRPKDGNHPPRTFTLSGKFARLIQTTSRPWQKASLLRSAALLASVSLASCGGGGSGGDSESITPPASEQPVAADDTEANSAAPALSLGADSFHFEASGELAVPGALDGIAGGQSLQTAWNPTNPSTVLSPGMKVMFFGSAQGCAARTQGPTDSVDDTRLAQLGRATGISIIGSEIHMRWTPSGRTAVCDAGSQTMRGASAVFISSDDADGGVGMLTTSGPQSDSTQPFFQPYPDTGQNGKGTNADLTGSFVAFRYAPEASDPVQPWLNTGQARMQSIQTMNTAQVNGGNAKVIQVKQQMMATFFNRRCYLELKGKPCQMQYLLNTGILRSGVSDWSRMNWFANGLVWHDPVQGGIPIVSGPIHERGHVTVDADEGMALWRSQGSRSLHATFKNQTFDVVIDFEHLRNVMKITAARAANVPVAQATDEHIAAYWGSAWNERAAWTLLTAHVGQEVFNPDRSFRAEIGGGFRSFFVGPQ